MSDKGKMIVASIIVWMAVPLLLTGLVLGLFVVAHDDGCDDDADTVIAYVHEYEAYGTVAHDVYQEYIRAKSKVLRVKCSDDLRRVNSVLADHDLPLLGRGR